MLVVQLISSFLDTDASAVRATLRDVQSVEVFTPWAWQARATSVMVGQVLPKAEVTAISALDGEWAGAEHDLALVAGQFSTRCPSRTAWRFAAAAVASESRPWGDCPAWEGVANAVAAYQSRLQHSASALVLAGWDYGYAFFWPALQRLAASATSAIVLLPVTPAMSEAEERWIRAWESLADDRGSACAVPTEARGAQLARALLGDADLAPFAHQFSSYTSLFGLAKEAAKLAESGRVVVGPASPKLAPLAAAAAARPHAELARFLDLSSPAEKADALADFWTQTGRVEDARRAMRWARAFRRSEPLPAIDADVRALLEQPLKAAAPVAEYLMQAESLFLVATGEWPLAARSDRIRAVADNDRRVMRAEFAAWLRAGLRDAAFDDGLFVAWDRVAGVPLPSVVVIGAECAYDRPVAWAPNQEWADVVAAAAHAKEALPVPFVGDARVSAARLALVVGGTTDCSLYYSPRAEKLGALTALPSEAAGTTVEPRSPDLQRQAVRKAYEARRTTEAFGPYDFCGRSQHARPLAPSTWGRIFSRPAEVFIESQLGVRPRQQRTALAEQRGVWIHDWIRIAADSAAPAVPEEWEGPINTAAEATKAALEKVAPMPPRVRSLWTEAKHAAACLGRLLNAGSVVASSLASELTLTPLELKLPSGRTVTLRGRLDLALFDKPFDPSSPESIAGARVHIIDVKTGAVPPLRGKSAIERREGLQLIGYAAWFLAHGARAVDLSYLAPDAAALASQLTVESIDEVTPVLEQIAQIGEEGRFGWTGVERLPLSTLIPDNLEDRFVATHGIEAHV